MEDCKAFATGGRLTLTTILLLSGFAGALWGIVGAALTERPRNAYIASMGVSAVIGALVGAGSRRAATASSWTQTVVSLLTLYVAVTCYAFWLVSNSAQVARPAISAYAGCSMCCLFLRSADGHLRSGRFLLSLTASFGTRTRTARDDATQAPCILSAVNQI